MVGLKTKVYLGLIKVLMDPYTSWWEAVHCIVNLETIKVKAKLVNMFFIKRAR